jgi:uncharacterized protein (DUF302 family)
MSIRKIEIERLNITSLKPFDMVVSALKAAIGQPDMAEFWNGTKAARTAAELRSGLMLFAEFDHGAIVRTGTGREKPRIVRFVIGNPLIMKEMAKHVPDAGSYAPVTVLVDERPDGVHLSYDKMTTLLAPYENSQALAVAKDLDMKVEALLRDSAASKMTTRKFDSGEQLRGEDNQNR